MDLKGTGVEGKYNIDMSVYTVDEFGILSLDSEAFRFGRLKKGLDTNRMPLYVITADGKSNIYVQSVKMRISTEVVHEPLSPFVEFVTTDGAFTESVAALEATVLKKLKKEKEEIFPNKGVDDMFLEAGQTSNVLSENLVRCRLSGDVQVWNWKKESESLESLSKHKLVDCILHVSGVWFTTSRWGVTLKVCQVRHEKVREARMLKGYMFPTDEKNDEESGTDEEDEIAPPVAKDV
jgi:hypothetical protein